MKMKSIDRLTARAEQHFADSISVKQEGSILLPTQVAKAIGVGSSSCMTAMCTRKANFGEIKYRITRFTLAE
jgi:hypothetical protein